MVRLCLKDGAVDGESFIVFRKSKVFSSDLGAQSSMSGSVLQFLWQVLCDKFLNFFVSQSPLYKLQ